MEGETLSPRQPIYPVPYAFSLRLGAYISDTLSSLLLSCMLQMEAQAGRYGLRPEDTPRLRDGILAPGPASGGEGSQEGLGVVGVTHGDDWPGDAGVKGESDGNAPAVHGDNTDVSVGVYGTSDSAWVVTSEAV